MGPLLIFLFALYQLQTSTYSEILDSSPSNSLSDESIEDLSALLPPDVLNNEILDIDKTDLPFVKTGRDQTEVQFQHPISSVNIDYSKNVIVLKFRKQPFKNRLKLNPEEEQKRRSLEANFMRFGRSPSDFMRLGRSNADFMRFGKREIEQMPLVNSIDHGFYDKQSDDGTNRRFERSQEGMRDSRGDNFMRFGKASQDFMRFGRGSSDFMRFGRNPADFMRFGKSQDFMRFGRNPADFMRFGRSPSDFMRLGRGGPDDFMRFGRNPADFMRFGRDASRDFMRFGRTLKVPRLTTDQNFMRFGRPDNFMRFGRSPSGSGGSGDSSNFMRFGKMDQDFMRFGKSASEQQNVKENQTEAVAAAKNAIKETAKLLRQTAQDNEELESNPMDKAIKVLYDKQQQQNQPHKISEVTEAGEMNGKSDDLNLDTDMDYAFNMSQ